MFLGLSKGLNSNRSRVGALSGMHASHLPERLQEISEWLELHPASELSELQALQTFAAEDQAQPFAWRSYRHNRVVCIPLHLFLPLNRISCI